MTRKINFLDDGNYGSILALLCPNCNDSYLHHNKIEIFEHKKKNKEEGFHFTFVSRHNFGLNSNVKKWPFERESGIAIHFWCENCDELPILNIYPHAGSTYMCWEKDYKNK